MTKEEFTERLMLAAMISTTFTGRESRETLICLFDDTLKGAQWIADHMADREHTFTPTEDPSVEVKGFRP